MRQEKHRFGFLGVLLTAGFLVFLAFLVILTIVSTYNPLLFDAVSQTFVNNLAAPVQVTRGSFEPFLGFLYTMTRNEVGAVIFCLVAYVVARIGILLLNRFRYHGKLLTHPWVRQITKAITIALSVSLLILSVPIVYMLIVTFQTGWSNVLIPVAEVSIYFAFAMGAFSVIYSIFRLRRQPLGASSDNPEMQKGRVRKALETLSARYNTAPKIFKKPVHEIKSAIIVFLYAFLLIEAAAWAPLPHYTIQGSLAPNEVLFDFHSHTTWSDGRLSPEDRVVWYMQHGLNGAAITDHHSIQGALQAKAFVDLLGLDFSVIIGQEYTASGIHMNIFGLDETIVPLGHSCAEECVQLNVSDTIAYVKTHGGYITVNHYASPAEAPYTYEQLRVWGVDGFEIVNGRHQQASEIRAYCLANNLICIGGSDIHGNDPLGCFTKITLPDPQNRSVNAIFAALRANTHQVITFEQPVNPWAAQFGLLSGIANYFLTLNVIQIASWMAWVIGFYIIVRFYYRKGRALEVIEEKRVNPAKDPAPVNK